VTRAELERALREAELPDAVAARERARRTVLAAHRPVRRPRLVLVSVAVAAALAAVAASARDTGPARAIERQVRAVFTAPAPTAPPVALPGRVLVADEGELFVFARGRRTALGRWDDADWSPRGRFVAVTGRDTLAAVEPDDGTVRWRLRRDAPRFPRWAPGGLHVAYRSAGTLRIVYGNGRHDVLAGRNMAAVAPAWRPGYPRTIAWAATDGTVTVEDADTAQVQWAERDGPAAVRHLAWSRDGRRLLIAGRRAAVVVDADGTRRRRLLVRGELVAAAYGRRLALAVRRDGVTRIEVDGRRVLAAAGILRDLQWSPDGRRLLVGWSGADHWLVLRGTEAGVVRHPFAPGARTRGWTTPR
jgi:hypothetical protein